MTNNISKEAIAETLKNDGATPVFIVRNASSVFGGKNVAFALDKHTAAILKDYGDERSEYQSDVRLCGTHPIEGHSGWASDGLERKPNTFLEISQVQQQIRELDALVDECVEFLDTLNEGDYRYVEGSQMWEDLAAVQKKIKEARGE